MAKPISDDPREVLLQCLAIAEQLVADGREQEALTYLRENVLSVLGRLAEAGLREKLGPPPRR